MAAVTYSSQKRPIFATIVALLSVVTMVCLGIWQWQRGEQKQLRLTQLAERSVQTPYSVSEVLALEVGKDIRDMPVKVTGEVRSSTYFLLDNRIFNGRVGYEVLVPMPYNGRFLVINFGWVPGNADRRALPAIVLPDGIRDYPGTVYVPTVNPLVVETAKVDGQWPKVVQAIDLDHLSQHLNGTSLPFVLQLDGAHPDGFERNWQPVVMPPEKHYGYAVQWFGLAIAAAAIYLFAVRKQAKHED